jgi:hypothetical protein
VRRTLAAVLVAGLLAFGCTGGEDEILDLQATPGADSEPTEEPGDPEPEAEDTEEPADEPEPEDPYAVPDEIDEDYVERVINAILEVQSEVLRGALQQEQGENLDPDLMALHFATTEGSQRLTTMDEYQRYIDDPESRDGLISPDEAGTMQFKALEVVHAEPDGCIIVVGYWDRTEVSSIADPEQLTALSLSRISQATEISAGNPTPWQWRGNTVMIDTEDQPIPREHWADLDYSGVLDNTCEGL